MNVPSLFSVNSAPLPNVTWLPTSATEPLTAFTASVPPSLSLSAPEPLSANTLPATVPMLLTENASSSATGGTLAIEKSRP